MKSTSGLIVVIIAIIMVFAQFGGSNAVNELYDAKPELPLQIPLPAGWPPTIDAPYPDIELTNQSGVTFKLSDYKGKVIIIIPINMNNAHSQALENALFFGSYEGAPYARNVIALDEEIKKYAPELRLPHDDLIFIHLIFHDISYGTPDIQDADAWARHFQRQKSDNHIVAIPHQRIPTYAANALVPGVQLIDRNFILRADSTGATPKTKLREVLIPMMRIALENKE